MVNGEWLTGINSEFIYGVTGFLLIFWCLKYSFSLQTTQPGQAFLEYECAHRDNRDQTSLYVSISISLWSVCVAGKCEAYAEVDADPEFGG